MHARPFLRKALFTGFLLTWVGATGVGFSRLWNYTMTPGPAGSAPTTWPAESSIARMPGAPTLVMFVHPMCPCSRASLAELGTLLQRQGPVDAHVLMLRPDQVGPEWNEGLTDVARSIPRVAVSQDQNGEEARRFGVHTSGHVVIYGADGRLVFSGGITGARGHIGDNPGLARAAEAISDGNARPASCPVFGCCLESHQ